MRGEDNIIRSKSYAFAVKIVKLCREISKDHNEYILTRQLMRSGTSIGANVEEAIGGQSRADFLSKLSIAYKEARETTYWLRLLHDTHFLSEEQFLLLHADAEELCRILAAIQKSTKNIRNS